MAESARDVKASDRQLAGAVNPPATAPETSVGVTSRAYPHLIEEAQPALVLIDECLSDAHAALDAYDDADIQTIASRLAAIAAQCAHAHRLTRFNESFGAVISFVRRAALTADFTQVGRAELNALIQALQRVSNEPMIGLVDATIITDALSESGWHGEHNAVETLLALLAERSPADTEVPSEA
jgi:hypothetical protein